MRAVLNGIILMFVTVCLIASALVLSAWGQPLWLRLVVFCGAVLWNGLAWALCLWLYDRATRPGR